MKKNQLKIPLIMAALALGGFAAHAQSPGGVPVAAWWRADASGTLFSDAGITPATDSSQLYRWNDATGHGYNLSQANAGNRPIFSNAKTLVNFNPSITFNTDYMEFAPATGDSIIGRTDGTLYAAGKMNIVGNTGFFGFDASNDFPGLHTYPIGGNHNLLFFTNGGPGYQGLSHNSFADNATFIAGTGWANDGGSAPGYLGATVSLNGDTAVYSGTQMFNVNTNAAYGRVRIGWDNNWGALNGELNEFMVFEDKLTYAQMQQVESYLAIKYGTTLDSGNVNYVSSSGSTVWSVAANTGNNHNIAGIARDDNGSLYQKQSWSSNTGKQVLISTTGLANTNAANTGTLTDGQYLVWGDNGLDKAPATAVTNIPGTNYRFGSVWKVQNTGYVGTVRVAWPVQFAVIKLVQSSDSTFASGNTVTDMTANTQTINGVTYNYADVTLADGQYFTFAEFVSSPGGIATMPAVWYKPDGVTSTLWTDASGSGLNLSVQSGSVTVNTGDVNHNFNSWTTGYSSSNYYNYIDPGASNTNLEINPVFGNYNTSSYSYMPISIFSAARPTASNNGLITGIDNESSTAAEPGLAVYPMSGNVSPRFYRFSNGIDRIATSKIGGLNQTSIFYAHPYPGNSTSANGDLVLGLNGIDTVIANQNGRSSVAGPYLKIGYSSFGFGAFQGDIQEVVWYKATLDSDDINKVETYFAIKYGSTLAHNYINAAGNTIFDLTTNDGYTNNIAGIGNEPANGGLDQKQSNSVNTGSQVLIATNGLANTNDSNAVSLAEGQYLIWGDNGLAKAPAVAVTNVPGTNFRFASVWKVQNTGSVGTVRIALQAGWSALKLVQSSDPTFASGNTVTDMAANIQMINGVAYNYADVTLGDGQYFTFAAQLNGPGGVALDLRLWLRSDAGFTPAEWTDLSGNSNNYTQTNPSRQPFVADQQYNFNPVVDFGGAQSSDGRFMAYPSGGPFSANGLSGTFFTATLTRSGGTSGYRDILGFGGTTTTASLTNADQPAVTKLNNDIVLYNTTISAFPNQYPDNTLLLSDMSYTVNVAGIKYGLNGDTASTNQTRAAGSSLQASGSILGSQPEVRNGQIGEVIAYERDLTEAEKQRVRSYIAIKYGITLQHNYIASDGTTILWDMAADTVYNNNIAGIARDDNGSLYQKESQSINTGRQVLIGTTGLAGSNSANTGMLNDGQSLLWGDNGLSKNPSIAITNVPGTNFRFAAVWKAQNIGSVGTVRVAWPANWAALKLVQNSDATFASGNTITDMAANTQTINGVTYNYADVTLADGQYFTFAAFVQAPGGVADGLLMWHRADDGTATAGTKDIWQDVSGNGRDVMQNNDTAYQPKLYTEAIDSANNKAFFFNYNPFYYFDGTNDFFYRLNDDYFPANTSAGTTYGVMFNSSAGGYNTPYGWGDDDPNLVRAGDNYQVWRDNGLPIDQNVGASSLPAMIGGMGWKGSGVANNGMYLNVNGKVYSTPSYNIGTIDNNDHNFAIGSEGFALTGAGNEHFQGGIAEVFAYSKDYQNDTTDAKQRINSYLAIKYGITLSNDSGSNVPDYLSSTSQVVWDATANAGYNSNIAGVAYDYNSGLQQKQSISENAGQQVLIGTTGLESTNAANATALTTDGQFLIWGDNGLAKVPSVYMAGMTGVNVRFKAIWKVQNTGSVGTVRVAWPAGLNDLALMQSADETFDASDAITDMSANTQDINGVTYNYADVTLSDGEYFTFATKLDHAPGGVFNNLTLWYRADKDADNTGNGTNVTEWTDYAMNVPVAQVDADALPTYIPGSIDTLNFNPGIKFTSAQKMANISGTYALSNVNFDIFTATRQGMDGGRLFSIGADNTTLNGANWDQPAIYGNGDFARRANNFGGTLVNSLAGIANSAIQPNIGYFTVTDTSFRRGLNGSDLSAAVANAGNIHAGLSQGGHIFGRNAGTATGGDDGGSNGVLGETIIYGAGSLSAEERNRVDAYLAIKYGVTLDSSEHYLASNGTIIFDSTMDRDFYHNVAGIGRDDISALYQKQSRSQITNNPNNEVTIGLGDIYATNFDNTDSVDDGQFLVWGDNGNTQAMTNIASTYATFTYSGSSDNRRMKRVWKVRNTDVDKAVKLRFPVASVGTTTLTGEDACSDYAIVYASDSTFTSNVTVAPLTVNGTDYEALHSFPQGASYFTFAKVLEVAAGIVVLPASTQTTTEYNQCATDGWRYFNQTGVPADKLLALKGMGNTQLDNLTITISPTGAYYDDGDIVTSVMPRVSTVTDASAGTYSGVDVRVYYSDTELINTQLPGAVTNSWVKYEGAADNAIADIQDDGVFTQGMASELTPDSTGTEDGVHFAEFHNVSSFSSFLYVSSSQPIGVVLPIRLLSFTAARNNQSVLLNWATASEQDSKGFEVEHSTDGAKWHSLGFVASKAQNGNSTESLSYAYTDAKPIQGKNYYRLKEVSFDGKYEYSEIRMVDFDNEMHISIYPNPVKENLTIAGLKGKNTIYVSNAVGQVMIREASADTDTKELSTAQLAPGMYMITIQDENNHKYNFKMVKQ